MCLGPLKLMINKTSFNPKVGRGWGPGQVWPFGSSANGCGEGGSDLVPCITWGGDMFL